MNVFWEIILLFILGGLYYLFQRRKYLKLHEKISLDFMKQIQEIAPEFQGQDWKSFELAFTEKMKSPKKLGHYPSKLHQILSEYLDYLESISGPLD